MRYIDLSTGGGKVEEKKEDLPVRRGNQLRRKIQ